MSGEIRLIYEGEVSKPGFLRRYIAPIAISTTVTLIVAAALGHDLLVCAITATATGIAFHAIRSTVLCRFLGHRVHIHLVKAAFTQLGKQAARRNEATRVFNCSARCVRCWRPIDVTKQADAALMGIDIDQLGSN